MDVTSAETSDGRILALEDSSAAAVVWTVRLWFAALFCFALAGAIALGLRRQAAAEPPRVRRKD